MHPFPPASKLQFLVGKEIELICLGQWQVWLHFGGKAHICVEGSLEHVDKAGRIRSHNFDEDRLSPFYLHHLFGQKVGMIEVEAFCLTLAFSAGDIIRIHGNEGPYECGQIYDHDGELTVF
jgi:hypothetical protein